MRYELTDHEWAAIEPMLPNRSRGVARVMSPLSSHPERKFAA
jgi:transposase